MKIRLVKTFFYTVESLAYWLQAILWTFAFIIIGKHSILAGIGYGLLIILGLFTLTFVFGTPKRRSPYEIKQTKTKSGLYDDLEICGRRVNWGLRLEQKHKSDPYNIDSKVTNMSSKIGF